MGHYIDLLHIVILCVVSCFYALLYFNVQQFNSTLVGGLQHFPHLGESSSQLTHIFQRGRAQPPIRLHYIAKFHFDYGNHNII